MLRKIVLVVITLVLIVAAFIGWKVLGPSAKQPEGKYFYVHTGEKYESVKQNLEQKGVLSSTTWFDRLARMRGYPESVKAGRYEIQDGMSLLTLVRMLKNGNQSPVNLTITKLRTKEDLAGLIGRKLETDSVTFLSYLNNNDTLKRYGLDTNTVMSSIFPNTYTYFWNTTPTAIFKKLNSEHEKVWNQARISQADRLGLNKSQAYTVASIIEEETNNNDEKGAIASVYLNRYRKGMRLQADPTVKFALRNFGLKRIYEKHLLAESPYNTYRYSGLPPGPICTPSLVTLDAVLNSPQTNYLYFVAKSDFSGKHVFSDTYEQHLKYAKEFQEALNREEQKGKRAKEETDTPR